MPPSLYYNSSLSLANDVECRKYTRRFSMILLGLLAGGALVLATVGIYGVISCLVAQRTREIGIRVALGARKTDVLRSIMSEGMKMALLGVTEQRGANPHALHVEYSLRRKRKRSVHFPGCRRCADLVALAASSIPARRAMRVDPIIALGYE